MYCSRNKHHREGVSCSFNNNCTYPECIDSIEYLEDVSETKLVDIATFHSEDVIANKAMRILKEKYDSTYFFCNDCDGLATKQKDCCLNYNLYYEEE